MSSLGKPSAKNLTSGPTNIGTPTPPPPRPVASDIKVLLANNPSPIKSQRDTRTWLEKKGWILAAKPYDCRKLVHVLLLVALTSKQQELRNASIAVALLLDDAILDHVSEAIVDMVVTKALSRIEGAATKLNSSADFAAAADARQAEALLALDKATERLSGVSASLDALLQSAPANLGNPVEQPPRPTWAAIAASAPAQRSPTAPHPRANFNPTASADDTHLQQWFLCNARTVLVVVDPANGTLPTDTSATGNSALRDKLNSHLGDIDQANVAVGTVEEGEEPEHGAPKTHAVGLSYRDCGAYVLEFISADAANRFCKYSADETWDVVTATFSRMASVKPKTYNIIARFVPCCGRFDPQDQTHLHTIENKNNLEPNCITSAAWLKAAEKR
ncbi:hypothetical protein C0989_008592, partial [Termitomyces sp. Mn162]